MDTYQKIDLDSLTNKNEHQPTTLQMYKEYLIKLLRSIRKVYNDCMEDFRHSRRRSRPRTTHIMLLYRIAVVAFFALLAGIVGIFLLFIWYSRDLPTPGKLVNADLSQSTRIFDRKGELLYSVYAKSNRVYVNLSDIPKDLQHATIAVEDKSFYTNPGFSTTGYLRAIRDLVFHSRVTGGSGLTQQLVRNTLISSERTLPRKIKELMLAIQVDKTYSKDQILELYLNDVGYGGANIGVEAAAESYFGKHVKDIDIAEAAFLAGLPQGPSLYSPYSGHMYYIGRTEEVLTQMVNNGYITDKQKNQALTEIKNKKFSSGDVSFRAPWFTIYVKELLIKQFGEQMVENGGLQVMTSLDYDIEKHAEQIVHDELDKIKNYHVANGAAVVEDPKTGEILAMVGNKDFKDNSIDGQVNDAMRPRQPGSSLKPVVYATAFNKGYTAASMVMDLRTDFPTNDSTQPIYTPVNYDGKFRGLVQLRFALGNSLNIPAVKTLARVSIKDAMRTGFQMGIDEWEPTSTNLAGVGLSLVLGGKETTLLHEVTAYSVFANQGIKQEPVFILKVTDSHGNTLYENHKKDGPRVLSPEVSFLISHILLDNIARSDAFGPNSYLVVPGKTVSVKTGTTDLKKDNWTTGYTPSMAVGVWVGNNNGEPMNQAIASGVTGASPIWNKIMSYVLKGKSDEQPTKPDNVNAIQIDALGGGLPQGDGPKRTEYFIKGTEPTGPSPIYQKLKISKHQGNKLANAAEIAANDYDTKDFVVFHEDDPVSTDGRNRWQDAINQWIDQTYHDDPKYHPPTDTSDYQENGSNNNNNPSLTPTTTPTPTINSQ